MNKESIVLDYDKINEYKNEFIEFNDYLPLILRESIYFEYVDYLYNNGDYNKVIMECVSKRPLTSKQRIDELMEWLKYNQEYKDIIK